MNSKSFLLLILVLLGAAGAVWWLEQQSAPQEDALLYAGIGMDAINQAEKVVVTKDAERIVHISKDAQGQWVVEEEGNYPADPVKIRKLLLALSEARRIEFKTDRAEQFATLGVADPAAEEEGAGVAVMVTIGSRKLHLIAGNKPETFQGSQYVRVLPQNEVWLINRQLELDSKPADWLDKVIANIKGDDIHKVLLDFPGAKADIEILRGAKGGEAKLVNPPAGTKQKPSAYFNAVMGASEDLELDEIIERSADYQVPKTAITIDYTTFGGLVMGYSVYKLEDNTYASFKVRVDEELASESGADGARAREVAAVLAPRFQRWYYKVGGPMYQAIDIDLSQITEPIEKEEPKAEPQAEPTEAKPSE